MDGSFLRLEMLLGPAAMDRLAQSHVAVVGLGGVGGWCAEALARSGVGELTLVDEDDFSESNINRQLGALRSTEGQGKSSALAARFLDISPALRLHPLRFRYEAESREAFFAARYDYIADCIDLVSCKLDLIEQARLRGIPVVSAMGTGNKLDAQRLEITDLSETRGCPLARVMRRELRRRGIDSLPVVYSPEEGVSPAQPEAPPPGRRSIPGSAVWVPASAGFLMAQHIVTELIK